MAEPAARDRRGLGRGLAALLGDGEAVAAGVAAGYAELPLDAIAPNPDQPRAPIDPDALEALAASIRASGVLQPVVVGPPGAGGRPPAHRRASAAGGRRASPGSTACPPSCARSTPASGSSWRWSRTSCART